MTRRSAIQLLGGLLAGTQMGHGFGLWPRRTKVVLCFDGSKSHEKLEDIVKFGDELTQLNGRPARFTMYANSTYWFTGGLGTPEIGYGGSKADIAKRLRLTQAILDAGHELGSHTVRHCNGSQWSYAQWDKELSWFDQHVAERFTAQDGSPYKCVGFRAPYLAINDELYKALRDNGYVYDFSQVGRAPEYRHDVLTLSVPSWKLANGQYSIGMDYNWMVDGVSNAEVLRQLWGEASQKVVFLSLHFADYRAQGEQQNYYDLVKEFCRECARQDRFEFVTMKDYVEGIR